MKSNKKITILVTAKNSEKTIGKCLLSLLNQKKVKNYDIYVTEAFSQDKTWKIISAIKEKYPKKIKAERIKGNAPHAFNYMIKKVDSPIIAFTDSDCVVDKYWLYELTKPYKKKSFYKNKVVATAGYCSTPKDVNILQKIIGRELEYRFKNAEKVKFLLHAPTMNFSILSSVAKKCIMDEELDVAFETEWGIRINKKYGKILYVPNAKVYHYHRSTLLSYFKQQFKQASFVPFVYLRFKDEFFSAVIGKQKDPISNSFMSFQIDVFSLFLFLSIISFFIKTKVINYLAISMFSIFLATVFYQSFKFSKTTKEFLTSFIIFFLRVPVWIFGILLGFIKFMRKLWQKK